MSCPWVDTATSGTVGKDARPSKRFFHSAALIADKIYIVGGANAHTFFNDIHEYDLRTRKWRRFLPSAGNELGDGRSRHTCVGVGNTLYLFGGLSAASGVADQELYACDVLENLWRDPSQPTGTFEWKRVTSLAGSAPPPRFQHTMVAVDETVYIFGGANALVDPTTGRMPAGGQQFNDLYSFHTSSRSWRDLRGIPDQGSVPPPGASYSMVFVDAVPSDGLDVAANRRGDVLVVGEDLSILFRLRIDKEADGANSEFWDQVVTSGQVPTRRKRFSVTLGTAVPAPTAGRRASEAAASAAAMIDSGSIGAAAGAGRSGGGPVGGGGGGSKDSGILMHVFGGIAAAGGLRNDMFALSFEDLSSDIPTWSKEAVRGDVPCARVGHTTTFVDRKGARRIFLFGGYDGRNFLSDFHFLDLDAVMGWHALPTPPAFCHSGTATLVGGHDTKAVVIVGGLEDDATELQPNKLARQLPVMNVSSTGHVSGRWDMKSISGGAKHAPPAELMGHSSVFDGDKQLVVFGGGQYGQPTDNVYILDTKNWKWRKAGEMTDGPSPRLGHAAAFFGGWMYVFGGYSQGQYLSDVYRLKIHLERKEAMSWEECAPSNSSLLSLEEGILTPRLGHSCVLIKDTDFYLFGGAMNGHCFDNKVYVFNPVTFAWSVLPVTGSAPGPRYGHTATVVLTGTVQKMFVIGGFGRAVSVSGGGGSSSYGRRGRHDFVGILNDLHILDIDEMVWTSPRIAPDPTSLKLMDARYRHSAVGVPGGVLVLGGTQGHPSFPVQAGGRGLTTEVWRLNTEPSRVEEEGVQGSVGAESKRESKRSAPFQVRI